jgi:hypothetical protein
MNLMTLAGGSGLEPRQLGFKIINPFQNLSVLGASASIFCLQLGKR